MTSPAPQLAPDLMDQIIERPILGTVGAPKHMLGEFVTINRHAWLGGHQGEEAEFGRWELPADWIELNRRSGAVTPAAARPQLMASL